jgi:hypothetical protein
VISAIVSQGSAEKSNSRRPENDSMRRIGIARMLRFDGYQKRYTHPVLISVVS